MERRYELRLLGITYNQIESGVYALILEEVGGRRRIPIIIGYPEAQAIECKLQEVVTPRPLTHDLVREIFDVFDITLLCVEIRKLPNGVFAAYLVMEKPDGSVARVDARSSDAIAIAIRTGAKIYTSEEVLDESGFYPPKSGGDEDCGATDGNEDSAHADSKSTSANSAEDEYESYSDAEIREKIEELAREEKYEEAARLQAVLKKRSGK